MLAHMSDDGRVSVARRDPAPSRAILITARCYRSFSASGAAPGLSFRIATLSEVQRTVIARFPLHIRHVGSISILFRQKFLRQVQEHSILARVFAYSVGGFVQDGARFLELAV